jgi:hypothetical protein
LAGGGAKRIARELREREEGVDSRTDATLRTEQHGVPETSCGAPSSRGDARRAQHEWETTSPIDAQKTYSAPPRNVATARRAAASPMQKRRTSAVRHRL